MLFPWDGTYLRISNASGYFRLQGSILELTLVLRLGEVQLATRASWRLAEALSRAEHRVSRRISVALQAEGMSLEQWRVLSLLSDGAGHTMSDIARDVMLPAASLTRVIDRLVEVNLVYRRGDLGDRRRVLVFVSPRGRSLHRKLAGTVDREEAALMAGIRDDDA